MAATFTTEALVTDTAWSDLIPDAKVETLAESFKRNRARLGKYPLSADGFQNHLSTFCRKTADGTRRPHESLSLGEIFAAYVHARLEEIEAEWSERLDALLADFTADRIDHAEFCRATTALEVSCGVRRTNATLAAYGVTYKEFVK